MTPINKRVTLKDIARRLGLSHPAVSQALTGSLKGTIKVSEATRERVRVAAAEMGYRPSTVARALRSGRSGLIGLVHYQGMDQIATRRLLGALDAIQSTELRPFIHHVDPSFPDTIQSVADALLGAQVEAVLFLMPPTSIGHQQVETLVKAGLPIAEIGADWMRGVASFRDDRRKAHEDVSRHVLDLGARRIALIGGAINPPSQQGMVELQRGFVAAREAFVARSFPSDADVQMELCEVSDHEVEEAIRRFPDVFPLYIPGYAGMLKLIERGDLPEAIICQVDAYALGAMRACGEHGIKVPQDIAFAGFGNEAAASAGLAPLTTADHPVAKLSRLAVEDLQLKLNGKRALTESGPAVKRGCQLIVRHSTSGKIFKRRIS